MSTTVIRSYFLERRGEDVRIIFDESEQLSGQNQSINCLAKS